MYLHTYVRMYTDICFNSSGTIKDDTIDSTAVASPTTTTTNVPQDNGNKPWYDRLASENDKTKKSDSGNPVTDEGEEVSERLQQQMNDDIDELYVIMCIHMELNIQYTYIMYYVHMYLHFLYKNT